MRAQRFTHARAFSTSYTDKSADAVCYFTFAANATAEPIVFEGRCQGRIVPRRGAFAHVDCVLFFPFFVFLFFFFSVSPRCPLQTLVVERKNFVVVATHAHCLIVVLFVPPACAAPPGPAESFGWDPIFLPNGHKQTYAEMDKATKNSISHRSRALALLKAYLSEHPEALLASEAAASTQ
jgi:hypothetical protein